MDTDDDLLQADIAAAEAFYDEQQNGDLEPPVDEPPSEDEEISAKAQPYDERDGGRVRDEESESDFREGDFPTEEDFCHVGHGHDYEGLSVDEDGEVHVRIECEISSVRKMLDEERELDKVLDGKERWLTTGCDEIDERVLVGGFERGRVVGITAKREDFGVLVSLTDGKRQGVGT